MGMISYLHDSRSKQYKSTSATYVLGKERSEIATGNKAINPSVSISSTYSTINGVITNESDEKHLS
jgi:hypothetical protein